MPNLHDLNDTEKYPALDTSRFDISHDVPVFDEHEDVEPVRNADGSIKRDEQGKPVTRKIKYTRDVLESIAENLNKRVRDTGDYTALCISHTPTPEQRAKGAEPQSVIGFAGPYYVGTWGRENPRPTIFAKNWAIFKDESVKAAKYPRRSVELWAERNLHDRYFDPISLLGAETPRRDLGLHYSKTGSNVPVYRYDATFPSGSNTFIPGEETAKRRYEQPEPEENMAISDEDIQKITAAVMETAPMQWASQQMASEAAKGSQTIVPPAGGVVPGAAPAAPGDPNAPADPNAQPVEQNAMPEAPQAPAAPEATPPAPEAAGKPEAPEAPPAAPEAPPAAGTPPVAKKRDEQPQKFARDEALKIRYAQLEAENTDLQAKLIEATEQIAAVRREASQVKRYAQVEQLSQTHLLNVEEELARAAKMSDEQWDEHTALITQHYRRNPVGRQPLPAIGAEVVQNDEAVNERIKEKINRYSKANIYKPYHEIKDEVAKEMAAK